MKFYIASTALLGAIGLVCADPWLPPCAQACVASTPVRCRPTDFSCACTTKKYIKALMYCIISDCSAEDQEHAIAYLDDLCHADWQPQTKSWFAPHWGLELRQFRNTTSNGTNTGGGTSGGGSGGGSSGSSGSSGSGGSSTSTRRNGLGSGAKAGIGVGITGGVLLIGALAGGRWWKANRGKQAAAAAAAEPPPVMSQPPPGPQEIDGTQRPWAGSELAGQGIVAAYTPSSGTHELPVNQQQQQGEKPPEPAQGPPQPPQPQPPQPQPVYQGHNPHEMPAGVPGWYGGPQPGSDPPKP
ncbi:hypothetical protein P152DRAFT_458166 [Eremomyces bilateralis CBS 781.70]|uniref:CFEM domain-containing protein n=1 Tax=Eremomyces bilateralis CBS 781.70 TaxID=1392243 RepID=A0A6G1G4J9_9PEZI|nr:uncharacterized protein P152DRAFT_458166 [Eremomyces bilateralis CBS 781.70]KAF1812997.1 hypothetical protein P152DRAFT_458166 [Eremomyces bilateralis CBS 781.70]